MNDIRTEAREVFARVFAAEPDGLWSAPGRVNIIGEHTDYTGGLALPFAIDRRTVVALRLREDARIRIASTLADELVEIGLDELAPDTLHGWSAYLLGVVWALGDDGVDLGAVPGFDLIVETDVPIGAGLASSASVEAAVALALNDIWRLGLDTRRLAEFGRHAENAVVGAPTGILDQLAVLMGRTGYASLVDCRSLDVQQIHLPLAEAGLEFVVIATGARHDNASGGYASRRRECEQAEELIGVPLREVSPDELPAVEAFLDAVTARRVRHVVTENARVLHAVEALERREFHVLGDALNASHASLRDDFEVSVDEIELAVETALDQGALGARIMGGGFGGSVLALAQNEAVSRIRVGVDGAFAEHGYGAPEAFVVSASHGAQAED